MKKRIILVLAALCALFAPKTAYAQGRWVGSAQGDWWQRADGSWPAGGWQWIRCNGVLAECYYFDENGYLLVNTTTPDGYKVNEYGAWTENGLVQRQEQADDEVEVIATFYMPKEDRGQTQDMAGNTGDSGAAAASEIIEIDEEELSELIAQLVNEEREKAGIEPLSISEELMENACERARESSNPDCSPHKRPDGSSFKTVLAPGRLRARENMIYMTYGYRDLEETARDAVRQWMESASHRKGILDSGMEETGVGSYIEDGRLIVVQLFTGR